MAGNEGVSVVKEKKEEPSDRSSQQLQASLQALEASSVDSL